MKTTKAAVNSERINDGEDFDSDVKFILEECTFIDSYKIEGEKVSIKFAPQKMISFILSHKSIFIPESKAKMLNLDKVTEETVVSILFAYYNMQDASDCQTITMKDEEFMAICEVLKMYNLKDPHIIGGYYVYSLVLDDKFRENFEEYIESSWDDLTITVPSDFVFPEKYNLTNVWSRCKTYFDMEKRAKSPDKTGDDMIDLLWEMAQRGLLKEKGESI